MSLELFDDPATFLEAASEHLAADPVLNTVMASVTARHVAHPAAPVPGRPRWWAVARDDAGRVSGAAMRTAPFAPYAAYVLPMPDEDALALARLLHDRGEELGGVNGALPTARMVADETARLTGGAVSVDEHLRLFELGELVAPTAPPGRLRPARIDDADLVLDWFLAFDAAAAEQAGRETHRGPVDEGEEREQVLRRIEDGVWLWEDETGEVVHLTAGRPPAYGVSGIGPVYTPAERRGRGYASRAVAEVSQAYVEQGVRCCLFTDQANPVSNHVYEAIGYRPVVDMVNLLITRPGPA